MPRSARLLARRQYDAALRQGRRLKGFKGFAVTVYRDPEGHGPRLGLTVPKKALPHAVARNRFKRQCRESFRLARAGLPPLDVVIAARAEARTLPQAAVRNQLERLWRLIGQWNDTAPAGSPEC